MTDIFFMCRFEVTVSLTMFQTSKYKFLISLFILQFFQIMSSEDNKMVIDQDNSVNPSSSSSSNNKKKKDEKISKSVLSLTKHVIECLLKDSCAIYGQYVFGYFYKTTKSGVNGEFETTFYFDEQIPKTPLKRYIYEITKQDRNFDLWKLRSENSRNVPQVCNLIAYGTIHSPSASSQFDNSSNYLIKDDVPRLRYNIETKKWTHYRKGRPFSYEINLTDTTKYPAIAEELVRIRKSRLDIEKQLIQAKAMMYPENNNATVVVS